jgi:hypothetical protein
MPCDLEFRCALRQRSILRELSRFVFNLSARQLFGVACFLCCRKPAELSHYPFPLIVPSCRPNPTHLRREAMNFCTVVQHSGLSFIPAGTCTGMAASCPFFDRASLTGRNAHA